MVFVDLLAEAGIGLVLTHLMSLRGILISLGGSSELFSSAGELAVWWWGARCLLAGPAGTGLVCAGEESLHVCGCPALVGVFLGAL